MCKTNSTDNHENITATATYLVIGAGTAGMSFIDSILTLNPKATVILVDRNSQPGGHWTKVGYMIYYVSLSFIVHLYIICLPTLLRINI